MDESERAKRQVEEAPVALIAAAVGGEVLSWNWGAEQLFGIPRAEAVGRPIAELIAAPSQRFAVQLALEEAVATGTAFHEFPASTRTGEELLLQFFCNLNADPEPWLSIVPTDRSELRRLVQLANEKNWALEQALRDLKQIQEKVVRSEKLSAIGQLSATVAHELRNPLSSVTNAWTVLRKLVRELRPGEASGKVGKMAEILGSELDRCARTAGQMLDFARERPLHRVPSPVAPLIERAVRAVVRPPDVVISTAIPADLPVPAWDHDRVLQVLINILQNAVEVVDPRTGVVSVRAAARSGGIVMEIQDNGPGIPADHRARLFEPLFTTKTRGTGLGLALVASVVQRHDGEVTVDSAIGRGTTFRVYLPFGQASEDPAPPTGGLADPLRR